MPEIKGNAFEVLAEEELINCIDSAYINQCNFLRWKKASFLHPATECPPECTEDNCQDYITKEFSSLPVISGDTISFLINTPVSYIDFPDLKLGIVKCCELKSPDIAPIQKADIDEENYFLHAEFEFPQLDNGIYNLVIYQGETGQNYLMSNYFYLCNNCKIECKTKLVEYRNSASMHGYPYADLPEFKNKFRLYLTLQIPQYPHEKAQYRDQNKKYRIHKSIVDRVVNVETEWFDEHEHEAMSTAVIHDEFTIEGTTYIAVEGYENESSEDYPFAVGRVRLTDQDFPKKGNYC